MALIVVVDVKLFNKLHFRVEQSVIQSVRFSTHRHSFSAVSRFLLTCVDFNYYARVSQFVLLENLVKHELLYFFIVFYHLQ